MAKVLSKLVVVMLLFTSVSAGAWGAKKITVKTIPETAEIFVDGQPVGEGAYTVKFEKNNEYYVVKMKAVGFVEKTITLRKSDPRNSILVRLNEDEAMEASIGSEDGTDVANTWFDITCRRGMTEDQVWKRLMSIATRYFSNIEVRDKAAGWIKSAWKQTSFKTQVVRTRLEVRMSFTGDDVISYRARISSEINEDKDCRGKNCFVTYDRVLKIFEPMIEELQTAVGGGE